MITCQHFPRIWHSDLPIECCCTCAFPKYTKLQQCIGLDGTWRNGAPIHLLPILFFLSALYMCGLNLCPFSWLVCDLLLRSGWGLSSDCTWQKSISVTILTGPRMSCFQFFSHFHDLRRPQVDVQILLGYQIVISLFHVLGFFFDLWPLQVVEMPTCDNSATVVPLQVGVWSTCSGRKSGKWEKKWKNFPMSGRDHVARCSSGLKPLRRRAPVGGAPFTGRYVPWWLGRFDRWDLLSRGCVPAHTNIVNCFYSPGGHYRLATVWVSFLGHPT